MELPGTRRQDIGRLSRFLTKYSHPRFQLLLLLLVAGSAGAGASFVLLRFGLAAMWLRYPLAAVIGYLTFLGLLRLWVQYQLSGPVIPEETGESQSVVPARRKPSAWDALDLLDLGSVLDDLPVAIIVIAIVIVLIVVIGIVVAAPVLLAEVLLDGLLVAGLWHRLNLRSAGSSLGSAVQATVGPALVVVICLGLIGFALQSIDPRADSIGDLVRSD
jgi:hypothetical protein